jgi:hypothetical protein
MKKPPDRTIKRAARKTKGLADIIDSSLSRGPGRPTLNKETLGAIRDDIAWLLSVEWQDIGWHLPKAKTPEELRQALAPLKGHCSANLVTRFLRPTLASATTREIRLTRKAFGNAVEHLRQAQEGHDKAAAASRVAEQAMNELLPGQQQQPIQAELLRRWRDSGKARKELEAATTALKAIEEELANMEAGFAQNELVDFITKKKYARNPLGLANAMAGLPNMTWQRSHERCSKIKYAQWPTFPFKVFKRIETIWKQRSAYPALSWADLFRQEVEKMSKTVMASDPDSGKKFKQGNHLRSHLADNGRSLRLAIEEIEKQQSHPGHVPFLILAAFTKNLGKPKTAQDSVLDDQERIR